MTGAVSLLRALVIARHWQKFETFQAQFRRSAGELADRDDEPGLAKVTVSSRQFERWIYGTLKTEPWPDACRILEYMFGYPIRKLLGPADAQAPAPETSVPAQGRSRDSIASALDIPVQRSAQIWAPMRDVTEFAADAPGEWSPLPDLERILSMAARRALRFGAAADSTNVGDESLQQINDELARLAAAYPRESLSVILGDIVSIQDYIFTLLEGRQKPRHSRDLYYAGALASGLVAKATHDYGDSRMAMTHARTALLCAENAEHGPLIAWVRGLQSLIAYWGNMPRESLNYAQIGTATAGAHGTAGIWLSSLEARAWSVLGNVTESRAAVERASEMREHLVPDDLDGIGGICRFSHPRQLYYAADASAMLWRLHSTGPGPADAFASDAVMAYESAPSDEASFGDEAGARTDLAIARIANGEIEGAREAIDPVLQLPVGRRIHGIVGSVIHVHQAIAAGTADSPVARDIQEEIEDYCSTPVAALPR
jgi:hypothetical protein